MLAGSVYCDGTRWVGEPEKGFWCYTKPAHPEPSCVLVEKCVTKIEEVHEEVRKQFILSFLHLADCIDCIQLGLWVCGSTVSSAAASSSHCLHSQCQGSSSWGGLSTEPWINICKMMSVILTFVSCPFWCRNVPMFVNNHEVCDLQQHQGIKNILFVKIFSQNHPLIYWYINMILYGSQVKHVGVP